MLAVTGRKGRAPEEKIGVDRGDPLDVEQELSMRCGRPNDESIARSCGIVCQDLEYIVPMLTITRVVQRIDVVHILPDYLRSLLYRSSRAPCETKHGDSSRPS